jgi:hypothetical protein
MKKVLFNVNHSSTAFIMFKLHIIKFKLLIIITILSIVFLSNNSLANDTLKLQEKGFTLRLINNAPHLENTVVQNLVDTYFMVYPIMVRNFNENSIRDVVLFIDPEYEGVAEAGGGRIRVSSKWLERNPNDFDLITHEVMHLIQAYPRNAGPWWITEGIADYARYVFGRDNSLGGWSLPELAPNHNYDNGYRITARFMVWIENKVQPGAIKRLDQKMRSKTYHEGTWKELTGSTLEQLWEMYKNNPVLN